MSVSDKNLTQTLVGVGLSQNESSVYLAVLSLGRTTAIQVSRKTKIKRGTIYNVIDSLLQKGLIVEEFVGFKRKFVAESPKHLKQVLEERKSQFEEKLPQLLSLYDVPHVEQNFRVYHGSVGLRNAFELVLGDLEVGDEYMVMANLETPIEILPKYFMGFLKRRATFNIKLRTILQDGPKGREYQKNQKEFNDTVRLFSKQVKFTSNVVVTPKKLLLPQLKPHIGAVIIENQQIISTQQQLFEIIWESLS